MTTQAFRIGQGYDVHRLVEGRPLILGGVEIPFEKGLLGHSDADVLAHAITDALLGALALGSIGDHFPDTDPKYKGADSMVLLRAVVDMITDKGYSIANVDSLVIAEQPKLKPHAQTIRESLAKHMGLDADQVSVKATTSETMGFVGREEGLAAQAVTLLVAI
ncbi:2-C-methyl-D-erythritol 2,4-cyclodiphosphate synthase [bacterium]|jgi:2-C-methyl-D-erythritol 2,4-cyclodiphosphate synthase|nr:2-C-methyl-D-erythritol 2,4-cyclodiphosphate synthase [bacterium]